MKVLDETNWLTLDPAWANTSFSRDGLGGPETWVAELAGTKLQPNVPPELIRLFQVARSALAYSLLFYPLLTLAAEQVVRVVERAAAMKCQELGAPRKIKTFADRIDWLGSENLIEPDDLPRWHAVRMIRNEGAHPRDQTIVNPAMALITFEAAADFINSLFPASNG